MRISFFVSGEPLPKQSFRAKTVNGKNYGYTPARIKAWQHTIGYAARDVMNENSLKKLTGKLKVTLVFERRTKRDADLDNLSKAVLDALQHILFENDKEVIELHLSKRLSSIKPGVYITVEELS